jgi:teichuronic acid biosynthesis glycosyltransferase TuaC
MSDVRGRIVVLTTSYPRREGDAAGHFVAAEASELAVAGHEVHVVCPGPAEAGPRGVAVHAVGGADAFGWPGAVARLREAPWRVGDVARFIAGARAKIAALGAFDRAIAHWLVPSAWPISTALAPDVRLTVAMHGADVRLLVRLPTPLRRAIVGSVARRAERIDFAAHALRAQLLASLDPDTAARCDGIGRVRAPFVQVETPAPAAREATRARLAPAENLCIGVVGRLVAGKRPDLCVRAAAAYGRKSTLVFVGDGPERPAVESLAEELGVRAVFTGQLARPEALATLAACDVLLHPSAAEAAPCAVREARVLGVRVVATDVGDVARWAERDRGIRIAEATPEALAAALG